MEEEPAERSKCMIMCHCVPWCTLCSIIMIMAGSSALLRCTGQNAAISKLVTAKIRRQIVHRGRARKTSECTQ